MLAYIRKWLAPPVFAGDEDKTRTAKVLNKLLLTIMLLATVVLNHVLRGLNEALVLARRQVEERKQAEEVLGESKKRYRHNRRGVDPSGGHRHRNGHRARYSASYLWAVLHHASAVRARPGLSQVYGIVKQHEGHIEMETEVGRGTTFRLYWPVTEATTSPMRQRSPPSLHRDKEKLFWQWKTT